jgi:glutamyl-tRNA reductase
VISSTAARQPVLTRSMVEKAMTARRRKPMFMVDIAVPRDIEAAWANCGRVSLRHRRPASGDRRQPPLA